MCVGALGSCRVVGRVLTPLRFCERMLTGGHVRRTPRSSGSSRKVGARAPRLAPPVSSRPTTDRGPGLRRFPCASGLRHRRIARAAAQRAKRRIGRRIGPPALRSRGTRSRLRGGPGPRSAATSGIDRTLQRPIRLSRRGAAGAGGADRRESGRFGHRGGAAGLRQPRREPATQAPLPSAGQDDPVAA